MLIKEAAKNLLDKNQITKEEYDFLIKDNELEKIAINKADKLMEGIKFGILGLGLGSSAVLGAKELSGYLKQQQDISKSYKQMPVKVPVLTEYPEDKIKDYFEVVKTFSPRAASNPLVAGALVHKMLEFGGVDHKLVQDLNTLEPVGPGIFEELSKATLGGIAKYTPQNKKTSLTED